MLQLQGIGHALPDGKLGNALLEALSEVENPYPWIQERRTTLPLEYIEATRNLDPSQSLAVASHAPTDLGESAARMALERADIDPEEVGLVIAGGSTPRQTTPSEAQRIGGRLGMKVPAYDLFSGGADLALQIANIKRWKPSRVPRYTLCISTSTATQRVNYSQDETEGYLFGDGACACVISNGGKEGFWIEHAHHRSDPQGPRASSIDIYGHLQLEKEKFEEWVNRWFQSVVEPFVCHAGDKKVHLFFDRIVSGQADYLAERGFSAEQLISDTDHHGYLVGCGSFLSLSLRWEDLGSLSEAIVFAGGVGQSFGAVSLRGSI